MKAKHYLLAICFLVGLVALLGLVRSCLKKQYGCEAFSRRVLEGDLLHELPRIVDLSKALRDGHPVVNFNHYSHFGFKVENSRLNNLGIGEYANVEVWARVAEIGAEEVQIDAFIYTIGPHRGILVQLSPFSSPFKDDKFVDIAEVRVIPVCLNLRIYELID